jgi:hypothetical protein
LSQISSAKTIITETRQKMSQVLTGLHPAAKIALFLVGVIVTLALIFTAYKNWCLYSRVTSGQAGMIIAAIPPVLLDGSIGLLLVLLLFYITDGLQKLACILFNVVLFLVVGFNCVLENKLQTGSALTSGWRLYLEFGLVSVFLLCLLGWEFFLHLDPLIKRRQDRAEKEQSATQRAHELEMKAVEMDLEQKLADVNYEIQLRKKMNDARERTLASTTLDDELLNFEQREAIARAKQVRSYHSRSEEPHPHSQPLNGADRGEDWSKL